MAPPRSRQPPGHGGVSEDGSADAAVVLFNARRHVPTSKMTRDEFLDAHYHRFYIFVVEARSKAMGCRISNFAERRDPLVRLLVVDASVR